MLSFWLPERRSIAKSHGIIGLFRRCRRPSFLIFQFKLRKSPQFGDFPVRAKPWRQSATNRAFTPLDRSAINDRYLAPWIFRRIARTTILAVAGNVTVGILLALAGGSARAEVGGDAVASTEGFSFGIVSMKA